MTDRSDPSGTDRAGAGATDLTGVGATDLTGVAAPNGAGLPGWWHPLAERLAGVRPEQVSRYLPPPEGGGRLSAVLILLADSSAAGEPPDLDVLLLERAATMRSHAGQIAFPGGATEDTDAGPAATALREATEEVGLDPSTVRVVAEMPALWLPPSNYVVTPVVGWWKRPHDVGVADPTEVARVARVRLADLADPAHRSLTRHPSGYVGPAFEVDGMLVWGFTAGLLSVLLDLGGWMQPWDRGHVDDLPAEVVALAGRPRPPDAVT